MKKKSKIKVLKDNQNNGGYTFVVDLDLSSNQNSKVHTNGKGKEITEMKEADDSNKIYKKKKVLTRNDLVKSSKGLKFDNPSQRNHSSIYE